MDLAAEAFAFLLIVAFVAGTIDAMAGGGGLLTIPALMAAGVPPGALSTSGVPAGSDARSHSRRSVMGAAGVLPASSLTVSP